MLALAISECQGGFEVVPVPPGVKNEAMTKLLKQKLAHDNVHLCTKLQMEIVMADDQAFLSARVPVKVRNQFKILAVSQGKNVQELLREVVGKYLIEQQVPEAASVTHLLRAHIDELRGLGVERLSLVGSVARGDATADSDIDLVLGFKSDKRVSLIDVAHIQNLLQGYIGDHKVDVSLWKGMRENVEATMRQDEIVIL